MTSFAPQDLVGRSATDSSGDKIGDIGQVYLDDQTGRPTWITVSTGLFGRKESFAPLSGLTASGDGTQLAVTKDQIKNARNIGGDGHVSDVDGDSAGRVER